MDHRFSDNYDKEHYYEIAWFPLGKSECECEEPAHGVFTFTLLTFFSYLLVFCPVYSYKIEPLHCFTTYILQYCDV